MVERPLYEVLAWSRAGAMMAIVLTATEGSIVATAMPTIVADLGGFDLFSRAFAVFLLTQPRG